MSHGYIPGFAFVIAESELHQVCPEELNKLRSVLANTPMLLVELACSIMFIDENMDEEELQRHCKEDLRTINIDVVKAYLQLIRRFKEKTNISLSPCYHDKDTSGDRFDDVDGAFWVLSDGVQEFTKAAKDLEALLRRKLHLSTWVMFI